VIPTSESCGRNIADVRDLRVDEAVIPLSNVPPIRRLLASLNSVGLGYIALGRE